MATAASKEEDQSEETGRIERTGLSRVLPFRRDADTVDDSQESSGGRVFSAFINRLPGRRQPASDPFLDKQTANAAPARTAADPTTPTAGVARTRTPVQPATARATAPADGRERSDSELWQMFNADVAGTANVRATRSSPGKASTPLPLAAASNRPPADNDSLPAWAREQPAHPQPRPQTRDLPSLVAQAKTLRNQSERPARTRVNPSSKPQAVPEAPPITRREEDLRLEQLLAEARRHQQAGALFEAYRVAVIAEEFAEREHIVFAPRQERPVDIVREIEQQMQESMAAAEPSPAPATPAGVVRQLPPSGPVAVAIAQATTPVAKDEQRTSDPFVDNFPHSQQSEFKAAAVTPPSRASSSKDRFDSEFPALHEWREVRANSPVSLAVSNSAPETFHNLPDHPVQQALATGETAMSSNRAPLLARAEAERDQMLAAGQGTSLFSDNLRSPTLATATRPDLQPVSVPAPPPLEVTTPKPPMATATVGGRRSSGGGMVWWVLGGLITLAGLVAVRYRHQQQPAGRR